MQTNKSCQRHHQASCYVNGDTLTLNCDTSDFEEFIAFNRNGSNQGGCLPLGGCTAGITQSGTTTSLTIIDIQRFRT